MPEETPEEMKLKIAEKYTEMQKNELIKNAAEELGIGETTFHKYKNYKPTVDIKKETEETEETEDTEQDFQETYKTDNEEEDDETEEDKTIYFD